MPVQQATTVTPGQTTVMGRSTNRRIGRIPVIGNLHHLHELQEPNKSNPRLYYLFTRVP